MTTRAVQVSTIPSIDIFVRHSAACLQRDDPEYKKCNCPKHLRYTHNGKQQRQSAKTRSWKIAEERRRKIEAQFEAADPTRGVLWNDGETGTRIRAAHEAFGFGYKGYSDPRTHRTSS